MDFAHAYLFGLTVLALYALGVALMTTQVSYPLYTSVPTEAFVAYHHRYNRRIPLVVVVPAFVMFVACAALPFLRPDAVPGWIAGCIAAGGLAGLLATRRHPSRIDCPDPRRHHRNSCQSQALTRRPRTFGPGPARLTATVRYASSTGRRATRPRRPPTLRVDRHRRRDPRQGSLGRTQRSSKLFGYDRRVIALGIRYM